MVKHVTIVTILTVMVFAVLLSGCSTINGAFRDGKSIMEAGITVTQKGADKQMADSLAWAVKEQTRLIDNGRQVQTAINR
jgi:predicted small secreted protein